MIMSFSAYGLVALGGALGAVARYGAGGLVKMTPYGFAWATFGVNVLGSLLMGLLIGWLAKQTTASENLRLFLAVGVLGGFTTFSTFSLDVFQLLERREIWQAAAYMGGSVLFGVGALLLGYMVVRGEFS